MKKAFSKKLFHPGEPGRQAPAASLVPGAAAAAGAEKPQEAYSGEESGREDETELKPPPQAEQSWLARIFGGQAPETIAQEKPAGHLDRVPFVIILLTVKT